MGAQTPGLELLVVRLRAGHTAPLQVTVEAADVLLTTILSQCRPGGRPARVTTGPIGDVSFS